MTFPVIDFHAHLMTLGGLEKICPEEQQTESFKQLVSVFEPVAQITEPIHDRLLRQMAMNYNCNTSRTVYAHFGKLFLMEALRLFKRHGLERLVDSMDEHGIKHTVIHSLEPLTNTREILDLVSRFPDRFSVFGSVSKDEIDPAAYLGPLVESRAIKGIKIHPMIGGFTGDDLVHRKKELMDLAAEYQLPVAIHTGHIPMESLTGLSHCIHIPEFEPLVKAFPKCQFVFMHGGWESWRKAIDMARKYPNIVLELSWQPARIIRRAVDALGAHRVIFGSDFPLFQQDLALHQVKEALSRREYEVVCCANALRLLKMESRDLFRPLHSPSLSSLTQG